MVEALVEQLQRCGLTRNEARVYVVLLQHGGLSGGDVGKQASIDRSLAYTILNNLADKGLVSSAARRTKKLFYANNPENLLNPVRAQEHAVSTLIPQLRRIRPASLPEQSFRLYEGMEGMKAYANLLLDQRRILSFGGTGRFYDLMLQQAPHLAGLAIRKFQAGQVRDGRIIGSTALQSHPFNQHMGFSVRVLPAVSPATTTICDDFVAIHLITDKPFAIVIRNPEIVRGYTAYFEFLWAQAKPEVRRTAPRSSSPRPRART